MKTLIEYINESKYEEMHRKEINISWDKCGKKIADKWKSIPSELATYMKQIIFDDINKFYNNTPRKQKVSSACEFSVRFDLMPWDLKDPANKLISIYKKIGMDDWMQSFFNREVINGNIIGISDSRTNSKNIDDIKFKDFLYNKWNWIYSDKLPGNGYNHLPGKLIEEYRSKFLDCISGAELTVTKGMIKSSTVNEMVPTLNVLYRAIYDKSKVNKLINDLLSDEEMKVYSKSLSDVDRGISQYYSSKRSGEYTGD